MRKYAFLFMGGYEPEQAARLRETAGTTTDVFTVQDFNEAKEKVAGLYREGYGALELCGAFGKENAAELARLTDHKMAIGYCVHDPDMDELFDRFFQSK